MPGPSQGSERMSGTSIKMEKSEESMGGGRGWSGGRDRDSSSEGAGGGVENNPGLDPQLWHACAGGMVQLPPTGARVIYFPQGHGEQAATPPEFPRTMGPTGTIPCRVTAVFFLADTETDEVYARIRLQPSAEAALFASDSYHEGDTGPPSPPPEKPASFAKTLTQSDANNGGGFSVPRYCAETIFPTLDYSTDPPVQTIMARDVHGERWKFRHIYRGTPRRHLLTTGWSTFVNQKKLVAGDAIVFLRTASGELCVGVRRSMRGTGGSDSSTWSAGSTTSHRPPNRWEVKSTDFSDFFGDSGSGSVTLGGNGGPPRGPGSGGSSGPSLGSTTSSFARNRARVTAQSVLEAASLAANGQPFEVVYYPRASTAEFCVRAQSVKNALDHNWFPGMRFKMAFETEDSSRISWFMGTIAAVQPADQLWSQSPWRVLQVNWDEPDLLQGVSRVSPWQVELVSTVPMQIPAFSLPKKKLRTSQPSEMNMGGPGGLVGMPMPMPMPIQTGALPAMFGHNGSTWGHGLTMEEVNASIEGARHERIFGLALSDSFRPGKIQGGYLTADGFYHQPPDSGRPVQLVDPHLNAFPFAHQQHPRESTSNLSLSVSKSAREEHQQQHGTAESLVASSTWAGASSSGTQRSPPLLLFGTTIHPDSKPGHPQHSGGSSSDCPISSVQHYKETSPSKPKASPSESPTVDNSFPKFVISNGKNHEPDNGARAGNLTNWLHPSGHAGFAEKQGSSGVEQTSYCKVFRDSEDVGRTLDLHQFSCYEELFVKLGGMFGLEPRALAHAMMYRDAEHFQRAVGQEPYCDFAEAAKRVIIYSHKMFGKVQQA